MTRIDTRTGWTALCVIQCAAMIDLAAAPLWVAVLMKFSHFDAREAGGLVSLYILGGVIGGLATMPWLGRMRSGRVVVAIGLGAAALCFMALAQATNFREAALLHGLAGLSVGPALAATESTIGRSAQPHRLFALTAVALSLTAAGFLAIMSRLTAVHGGALFFQVICVILALGAVTAALLFPRVETPVAVRAETAATSPRVPSAAWWGVAGLFFMSITYSMTMSFVERVGDAKGYGAAFITAVLSVMAFIKLFPAAIAGLLEHRLAPRTALLATPLIQAVCSAAVFGGSTPGLYAVAACLFIGTLIFAHVFAFGLISRLDPSGRVVGITPSMMMAGSAVGPILAGSVIKAVGYSTVALIGPVIGALALMAFWRMTTSPRDGSRLNRVPATEASTAL